MIAPRRLSLELRALLVPVALLAAVIGFLWWQGAMIRKNDRAALGDDIVNGRLENPELLRGRDLFTDAELDALLAEGKRRAAGSPPKQVFRP
jgi:hypothetical protein